jgi:hypothetical protein
VPRLVVKVQPIAEVVEARYDPEVPEAVAMETAEYWRRVVEEVYRRSVNRAAFHALLGYLTKDVYADLIVEEENGALKVTLTDEEMSDGT